MKFVTALLAFWVCEFAASVQIIRPILLISQRAKVHHGDASSQTIQVGEYFTLLNVRKIVVIDIKLILVLFYSKTQELHSTPPLTIICVFMEGTKGIVQ